MFEHVASRPGRTLRRGCLPSRTNASSRLYYLRNRPQDLAVFFCLPWTCYPVFKDRAACFFRPCCLPVVLRGGSNLYSASPLPSSAVALFRIRLSRLRRFRRPLATSAALSGARLLHHRRVPCQPPLATGLFRPVFRGLFRPTGPEKQGSTPSVCRPFPGGSRQVRRGVPCRTRYVKQQSFAPPIFFRRRFEHPHIPL